MKFQINQPVFVEKAKKKGVIKEFKDGLIRVTYFDKSDKRIIEDLKPEELKPYNPKQKNKKNYFYRLVRVFHKVFGHPAPDKPVALTSKQMLNRASWTLEEMIEGLHATAKDEREFTTLFNELIENGRQTYNKVYNKTRPDDVLAAQVDAFTDAVYFGIGGFVEMGIEPERPFEIVHGANMAKIFPDGLPHHNEQGKIIKPDGWVSPDEAIAKEVERQKNRR